MKKIFNPIIFLFKTILFGFFYNCQLLAKGFFFYFKSFFAILNKIFHFKTFKRVEDFFRKKQDDPALVLILILIFITVVSLQNYLYVDHKDIVHIDDNLNNKTPENNKQTDNKQNSEQQNNTDINNATNNKNNIETNLYRIYSSKKPTEINISKLKEENNDVVAWLIVDGTSINYPIVQTTDNDYYLNHNIRKNYSVGGWTFMDYRNSFLLTDANTIFYGHNLLNKTSFGSLSNVFTDEWFKSSNHLISIITKDKTFTYEIFSCYYIEPEVYYLQNNFLNNNDYQTFLNELKIRSTTNFNVNLTTNDKIITLSTCTDDNKGRRVVHAKKIS